MIRQDSTLHTRIHWTVESVTKLSEGLNKSAFAKLKLITKKQHSVKWFGTFYLSFNTLYFFLSCLTCLSVYNLLKKLRKIGREQLLSLTAFFSCLFTQHKRNYNSGKAVICCHGDQTTLNNSSLGWCASYHRYGTWAMNRCLTRPLGILFPQNILQSIYVKERIHPFSNPVSFKILTGHSCVF